MSALPRPTDPTAGPSGRVGLGEPAAGQRRDPPARRAALLPGRIRHAGPVAILLGAAAGGAFLIFLGLPLVALVARQPPGHLLAALTSPEAVPSLLLSLETTTISLALAVLFGLPLAYLLARVPFPGRGVVETLVTLPTVLPPAVAGVALLVTFGRRGLLGQWLATTLDVSLPFTTAAVVMAQVFVAAPFFVNAARSAIAQLDPSFEEAAAVDGATRVQALTRVSMPLVAPALFSGAALTWARALGEFGATIVFAGSFLGRTETAPLAIYFAAESSFDAAIALSVVLLAVSFAVLLAARALRPGDEAARGGLG
jgi:molybdate transport system permease protein